MLVIGPDPVATDCKAWFDSSEYPGSGTTWSDLSGNANNASFAYGGLPTHTAGTSGFFTFDYTANKRAIINPFDPAIVASGSRASAACIEVWAQGNDRANAELYDGHTGTSQGDRLSMRYQWGGNDHWNSYLSWTGGSANLASSGTAGDTNWHQIVANVDVNTLPGTSNKREIYIDGALSNSLTSWGGVFNSSQISRFTIGGQGNTANPWDGKIAIVRIYDRGLTASEVLKNFNSARKRFGL